MTGLSEAPSYPDALRYITSTGRFGIKLGLERTRALLDAAGAPDRGLRGVLVAGTNGKGSTCAFISAVLHAGGLRAAAMPKPHLSSYTERVLVDQVAISEAEFAAAVSGLVPSIERVTNVHGAPTEFEILTTLALCHARDRGADLMVCEVGMGGRLDATNVTDLGVKVITVVDLDHQQYLGDTVTAIATEKAGIIQRGDVVVCGPLSPEAREVAATRCQEVGARAWLMGRDFDVVSGASGWDGTGFAFNARADGLRDIEGLHAPLLGAHQVANAGVAVAALQLMASRHDLLLTDETIRQGLTETRWPGRLEVFEGGPQVLVDGAHNPAAVAATVAAVDALAGGDRRVEIVFGAMGDKDISGMMALLPPGWATVFTEVREDRAQPAPRLLAQARELRRRNDVAETDIARAIETARRRAGPDGLVLVMGSLYLAGEARAVLLAGGPAPRSPIVEE
ncbi:MAG: folylpolyglutamate synthase/dihydrofolate synthase family protein [Candidatus Dormibacteria bacterium]